MNNTDFQFELEAAESTLYPVDRLLEFIKLSMNTYSSDQQVQKILDDYFDPLNTRQLLLAMIDGQMYGIIGIELLSKIEAHICHICVDPDLQWRGIGQMMIEGVILQYPIKWLTTIADDQNVGFFEACGFKIEKFAHLKNENDQFRCTKLIVP